MASGKIFKIGKMLINVSGKGIATKDTTTGEIRRMRFPWASPKPVQPEPEANEREAYDDEEQYADDQDNYQDYDDQEQDYDDNRGYSDEDYDEGDEKGGLLNAAWFMWAMLILLPPFGIWLLWRRNRYEFTTRTALSLVFIVWFVLLLVLLFTRVGGRDNTVRPDTSTLPSVSATATATATPTASPSPTPNAGSASVQPSVTPNANGTAAPSTTDSGTTGAATQFVYSVQGGKYFHSNPDCDNMTGASRVTLSVALSRNQTACPKCYQQPTNTPAATSTPLPAGSYYATPTGSHYHTDPTCNGMKNAQVVTQAEAIGRGQTACPTCVGSVYMTANGTWYHSQSNCQGMTGAKLVTIDDAVKAGKTPCPECIGTTGGDGTGAAATSAPTGSDSSNVFYCTDRGTWYHSDEHCQGMTGAYKISAAAAEQKGKTPCPRCLGGNSGVDNYYATTNGKWYHTDRNCQGMTGATRVSLATALRRGQTACPVCAGGTADTKPDIVPVTTPTANPNGGATTVTDGEYYSTTDGTYFHKNATCSGMKNATKVTAAQIAERGQKPCPKCVGTSGTYYSTPTGTYYHANATCSGMKNADIVTLAMIRSRGQKPCPKCIGGSNTGDNNGGNTGDDTGTGYYYATAGGEHYHSKATCSGMKGATKITQAAAEAAGKTPCPTCVGSVYSAGGKYYHKDKHCDGMQNAKLVTILAAEKAGQTACPKCIGGTAPSTPDNTGDDDDSDLAYYATENGDHYHRNSTCSGMKGATKISEAAAKKAGKTPCPKCIGTVYAVDGGDYYHKTATCSGMKNARLMTVDQAELSGHAPCPTCMGGTPIDSGNDNTGGNTGAKVDPDTTEVWVTIEGSKYHSEQHCSGMKNAAKTTLSWALSHNYARCTTCNAPSAD